MAAKRVCGLTGFQSNAGFSLESAYLLKHKNESSQMMGGDEGIGSGP
ncbi:hypothetical protein OZL92_20100 [Bacillus sonorensis]|nr:MULTISPECIES: hypothetical protein [Bacillus]TWK72798.1 hypothetical protein CHCC20335_1463 [Bacillus paralicheniformis]MCZ0074524.1 hypothetical protein [Bacillus sonorensis]MCZ0093632.1 hypothetical protein [Bacillus sonorensis]MEC0340179.1 hypothetical protein [Bacillus sonorensis]MEC0425856.1 hypothetical protein [Bacillus sonorensis]